MSRGDIIEALNGNNYIIITNPRVQACPVTSSAFHPAPSAELDFDKKYPPLVSG
jgi:hypothetical protein